MRRTLVTTEKCLREIMKLPLSIWYLIVNKQDIIVVSTNEEENKFEYDSILQRLHNKQVRIIPQSNIINQLLETPKFLDELSDCLFLLEIPKVQADKLSTDFGICCNSFEYSEPPYITNEGWNVKTDDPDLPIQKSWYSFYEGVNRNCTSALIIDRFLFSIEWNKGNGCLDDTIDDCKYNLKCIMDNIIPFDLLDNKFVLTIIFNDEGAIKCRQKDRKGNVVKVDGRIQYEYYTFDEFVDIIEQVRNEIYRPFNYDIEVLSVNKQCKCYNDTHDRYVITNFHISTATQKLVAFTPDKKILHKQRLFFDYIYSNGLRNNKSSIPIVIKECVLRDMSRLIIETKDAQIKYAINGIVIDFREGLIKNKLLKEYINNEKKKQ